VLDRECVDRATFRVRFTVGDESCQLRCPVVEFLATQAKAFAGSEKSTNPALWLVQREVHLQRAIELPVRVDAFPWRQTRSGKRAF
jgi:hypothetical protein